MTFPLVKCANTKNTNNRLNRLLHRPTKVFIDFESIVKQEKVSQLDLTGGTEVLRVLKSAEIWFMPLSCKSEKV